MTQLINVLKHIRSWSKHLVHKEHQACTKSYYIQILAYGTINAFTEYIIDQFWTWNYDPLIRLILILSAWPDFNEVYQIFMTHKMKY